MNGLTLARLLQQPIHGLAEATYLAALRGTFPITTGDVRARAEQPGQCSSQSTNATVFASFEEFLLEMLFHRNAVFVAQDAQPCAMPSASRLGEYLPGAATGTHFFVQAQLQRFAPSFRGAFISELRGGEQG